MAREIEAHRLELLRQLVHRQPGIAARQHQIVRRAGGTAEEIVLACLRRTRRAVRHGEDRFDRVQHLRAVGVEAIEGARLGQAFKRALVDDAGIDAPREIPQRAERPALLPRLHDMLDGAGADVLQCRQRIENRAIHHREIHPARIDRRRHDLDADALRLAPEQHELVGVAHVERHRGGEELHRVIGLEPGRLVGDDAHRPRRGTC